AVSGRCPRSGRRSGKGCSSSMSAPTGRRSNESSRPRTTSSPSSSSARPSACPTPPPTTRPSSSQPSGTTSTPGIAAWDCPRRRLFVGGKGGTGKTSISSGLAMARALDGGRVLLVSTDPAHNLGDIWRTELADEARRVYTAETGAEVGPGFVDAIEVDPQATIDAHFATVEAMMRRMLPERTHAAAHDHLRTAKSAPGSHES